MSSREYYLKNREKLIARASEYQKQHREKFREYQKQWEREHKDARKMERHLESCAERRSRYLAENPTLFIKRRLLSFAKCRAKKFGIPFNLTIDDIEVPVMCPVLGVVLSVEIGKRSDNAPSLDRLVPERGYIVGNIRVISWRANRLKGDATLEDLKSLVRYLEE